jgi:hypothetical protein
MHSCHYLTCVRRNTIRPLNPAVASMHFNVMILGTPTLRAATGVKHSGGGGGGHTSNYVSVWNTVTPGADGIFQTSDLSIATCFK